MAEPTRLLDLNAALDRAALHAAYRRDARVQVRDVLTLGSATALRTVLERQTAWGLAWAAAGATPSTVRAAALKELGPAARIDMANGVGEAARRGDFAFLYAQYPMLDAYLQRWNPGGPHDAVLELVNDAPMLEFVREVTGIPELCKADAQATLFAPGHFLTLHDDRHAAEGRRVAYVLGMATDWRPDWGGYLLFYDEDGDVVTGYKPRFNCLNLFTVPQQHSVSYVPPFAPTRRLAVTGWFRDR